MSERWVSQNDSSGTDMIDTTALITPWRPACVAELGAGGGSTGHKISTATPRGVACGDPSALLSWDVPRDHAGWAFAFHLVDPAQGWDRALCWHLVHECLIFFPFSSFFMGIFAACIKASGGCYFVELMLQRWVLASVYLSPQNTFGHLI